MLPYRTGQMVRHATVILANGTVEATVSANTVPWMEAAPGALAVGTCLLVPTDDGIARVEVRQGHIVVAKTFPDTEPFVDAASRLLAGPQGLYVGRNWSLHLLALDGN